MNKLFYQFSNDYSSHGTDSNTFTFLNPVDDEDEPYERVDQMNPVGEASHYTLEEFNSSNEDMINTFKLEFIYD